MPDMKTTFRFWLDDDTRLALQRLANAEDRSMASMLRILVRKAAAERGLWRPTRPSLVDSAGTKAVS